MRSSGEPKPQIVKTDFLIWPEKGLSKEDQGGLETKIQSVIGAGTELHRCIVLESEGIRFWVATITREQSEKVKGLLKVCLRYRRFLDYINF
jgi:hypothetical protein